jgi:hypothetical protein
MIYAKRFLSCIHAPISLSNFSVPVIYGTCTDKFIGYITNETWVAKAKLDALFV